MKRELFGKNIIVLFGFLCLLAVFLSFKPTTTEVSKAPSVVDFSTSGLKLGMREEDARELLGSLGLDEKKDYENSDELVFRESGPVLAVRFGPDASGVSVLTAILATEIQYRDRMFPQSCLAEDVFEALELPGHPPQSGYPNRHKLAGGSLEFPVVDGKVVHFSIKSEIDREAASRH